MGEEGCRVWVRGVVCGEERCGVVWCVGEERCGVWVRRGVVCG